ncbi:hypothetical protein F5884DRAFT_796784 [Xylogone sp. PMI_703]|nr:hypothetical protein F5884DRAFT_796784 [Xylogone sp. PMI_703]
MKIEELPDDFNSSVKISENEHSQSQSQPGVGIPQPADLLTQAMNMAAQSATTVDADGSPAPSLPPGMASMRNKSGAEILADLNKSPLFMTELEENDDLEAIRALAYEGTPAEVAAGFKERGNECFAEKKWKDAKEFYTKGIQVLLLEVRKRQRGETKPQPSTSTENNTPAPAGSRENEPPSMDPKEIQNEISILETTLVNRAACHLSLQNYRSATMDCAHALRINPSNIKAYYRSARALLALNKIKEADDACARGLELDPENAALKAIAQEIIKKNNQEQEKKKKELKRLMDERKKEKMLQTALTARGIKTRKTAQPPEMEDACIALVPDPLSPESSLSFPAILLYPLHLESDFIKAFNETETLGQHLEYILPLPWDTQGAYTPSGVECYMETITGGLVKVGKKVPLLKVLGQGNVEVVDEVVRIFIVPKGKSEEWVAEFKRKKAAEKKT